MSKKGYYIIRDSYCFKRIDSEIKAYLLGLISADGNLWKTTISLGSKDLELIEIFSNYFNSKIQHQEIYRSHFKNKEMSNDLRKLGLKERKSINGGLTKLFRNVPDRLKKHFVRGFLDGDGSINILKSRFSIVFYNTDKKLLSELIKYLKPTKCYLLGKFKKYKTVFALTITRKENFFKIYHLLYNSANYYLNRKKDKFLKVMEFEHKHGNFGKKFTLKHRDNISKARIAVFQGE